MPAVALVLVVLLQMAWLYPEWAWTLLALVPLAWVLWRMAHQARQRFITWMPDGSYQHHRPLLKNSLRWTALLLLLLALMGPYLTSQEEHRVVLGRQIYFLLDVSASMNAADIRPTRLEKAKAELKRVVEQMKGEKMGLIVFANHAYVQCPLTTDHRALLLYLDMAGTDVFLNTGTDLRQALNLAAEQLGRSNTYQEAKAVVLVTDGEDFGQKYQSAVNRLRQQRIALIPVSVGTPQGARVPVVNEGKIVGYKQTKDGRDAISTPNTAALTELADEFDTKLHSLATGSDNLISLRTSIQNLPLSSIASPTEMQAWDRYQLLALLALVALLASLFLLPQRKEGHA